MIRRRCATISLLLVLAAAAAPPATRAQAPLRVGVGVAEGAWRPVVSLRGVLADAALRDALAGGLPLRFRLRLELWRKGTFDQLVEARESGAVLTRATIEPGYTLQTANEELSLRTRAEAEAALESAFVSPFHPPVGTGRFYYLATLDVETLSLSDLEELRRWLRGEARPAVQGRKPATRALGRGLRRFFVRLLGLPTRHYVARSRFFSPA